MGTVHKASVLTAVAMMALAGPSVAQPPRTPGDFAPTLEQSRQPVPSKSDAHRIVGKVLEVDRERGLVKLSTEDGVRVVQPHARLLAAVRVGDTISVPRSVDEPISASPRQ